MKPQSIITRGGASRLPCDKPTNKEQIMDLQIPGYQIIRPIAEGGMASVYLAIQESLQRQVALKLLRQFENPVHASRFRNEGQIIASLNHRNVITIHDIGAIGERYYLAMEYLEDGDLEKRISTGMAPDAALGLVEAIGSCVDFLHRRGIIHRDIKPANILFRKDGTPVLTDFGIAKQLDDDVRLTLDRTALGSPHYLSPEQAECKPVDGRTDIYGLGIIFYEMLTGRKPFDGVSPIEAILAHLTEPVPLLPAGLSVYQELLDRMIAKAPDARFQTAGDMVTAIRGLQMRRQKRIPSVALTPAIRQVRNAHVVRQGRRFNQRASFLIVDALKQVWSRHLLTAWRTVKRQLVKNLLENTRLRRVAAVLSAVLLVSLAAGGLLLKSTEKVPKEHVVQGPTAQPTTHPVVLGLSDDVAMRKENNLQLARQAFDELRLTTPEGNNAWYYYRRVLEEDPNNTEALTGTKHIADIYADLAGRAFDRLHYRTARSYIERGLVVDPSNERLLKLKNTSGFSYTTTRALERVKSLFR
jgi:serine/threonine protein kinase